MTHRRRSPCCIDEAERWVANYYDISRPHRLTLDLRIAVMRALEQTENPHSPWTVFADKVVAEYGGTVTRCPLEGVHEHAFRGPHRFHEWAPDQHPGSGPATTTPDDYPARVTPP